MSLSHLWTHQAPLWYILKQAKLVRIREIRSVRLARDSWTGKGDTGVWAYAN